MGVKKDAKDNDTKPKKETNKIKKKSQVKPKKKEVATKPAEQKKKGRPSIFEEKKDYIIRMAELGLTDAQICSVCNIDEQTLNNWKHKYPEFFESLKNAKLKTDMEVVQSLRSQAMGYNYLAKAMTKTGKIAEYTDYKHPNITATIYWLKNRLPEQFRDKPAIEMTSDTVNNMINIYEMLQKPKTREQLDE